MSNVNSNLRKGIPTLSDKEFVILSLLIARGTMYGLELVENSDGELKRGTIYVTLQRMVDKGFVESVAEERTLPEIGIPRRVYNVTGLGQRVFRAQEAANNQFDLVWGGAV